MAAASGGGGGGGGITLEEAWGFSLDGLRTAYGVSGNNNFEKKAVQACDLWLARLRPQDCASQGQRVPDESKCAVSDLRFLRLGTWCLRTWVTCTEDLL